MTPYYVISQKSQKDNTVDSFLVSTMPLFMARFHSNFARQERISFVSQQSVAYHCSRTAVMADTGREMK